MIWSASTRRRVRDVVQEFVDTVHRYPADDLGALERKARSLLPLLAERRAPAKVLPGISRKAAKEAKREKHRSATDRLHEAVFRRAKSRCEFCGQAEATDLHHFIGAAQRRKMQAEWNCAAACRACHNRWHDHPKDRWQMTAAWENRTGLRFAGLPKDSLLPAPERGT